MGQGSGAISHLNGRTGADTCFGPRCTKAQNGPAANDRKRMHEIYGRASGHDLFTCEVQEQHSDSTLAFLGECW